MTAVTSPDALADPVGVIVGLVAGREPALDRAVIARVAEGVAGGRAKRRRLAQALLDNPGVLADGRSPAPRAVADLLIALRRAGAVNISPPACAGCGKQLRSYQRRGEDWYCSVCGPVREPCSACGRIRPVNSRDRDGKPRCAQCPPGDGDPVAVIAEVVTSVDPSLTAGAVTAAVLAAVPRAGQRRQLAWALQDRPGLLTGAGADAPVPAVLRLIDRLCDAGAQAIVRPACPGCGRVIHLHRPIGGQWLCRNCTARSRARPCSRCGAVREAATRDEHGRPLCPHCLITDPANQEDCSKCGRRRPVAVRAPGGPAVPGLPARSRSRHAQSAAARRRARRPMATGQPWCRRLPAAMGANAQPAGRPGPSTAAAWTSRSAWPAHPRTPRPGAPARTAGRKHASGPAAPASDAHCGESSDGLLADGSGNIRPGCGHSATAWPAPTARPPC